MTYEPTYQVLKVRRTSGREDVIACGIETHAEAAEIALRLYLLQEIELGGTDEFIARAE